MITNIPFTKDFSDKLPKMKFNKDILKNEYYKEFDGNLWTEVFKEGLEEEKRNIRT